MSSPCGAAGIELVQLLKLLGCQQKTPVYGMDKAPRKRRPALPSVFWSGGAGVEGFVCLGRLQEDGFSLVVVGSLWFAWNCGCMFLVSVQSVPFSSVTVRSSPVPVQSSPVQSSPVQSSPVQSSPVQSSPVQSSPVQSISHSRSSSFHFILVQLLLPFIRRIMFMSLMPSHCIFIVSISLV